MNGLIEVNPEVLKGLVEECISNRKNYDGSCDVVKKTQPRMFGLIKGEVTTQSPHWTYDHCGIGTRLLELLDIANSAIRDGATVRLTETTYLHLNRLKNKSEDFQPYVFGNGH